MDSANARQELEHWLASRGLEPATLSVPAGIGAMLDFYRDVRAADCDLARDGDMLLFQWGTYTRRTGPRLELDLTRQLIRAGGEDEDIWQLSLTFVFAPREVARGNRWCRTPDELDAFAAFLRAHPVYRDAVDVPPLAVELDLQPS